MRITQLACPAQVTATVPGPAGGSGPGSYGSRGTSFSVSGRGYSAPSRSSRA